jgi:hypothetical protein
MDPITPSLAIPISNFQQQIQHNMRDLAKNNTSLAYDPKAEEFKKFCRHVYGDNEYAEIVTEEKMYLFLLYQSHRTKRKQGGRRTVTGFDAMDYDQLMSNPQNLNIALGGARIGHEAVTQYYSAVLKVLEGQPFNRLTKSEARSSRVVQLLTMV